MTHQSKPLHSGRWLIQGIRRAFAMEDGVGRQVRSHHIPLEHADGRPPTVYTVDLARTARGTFVVSCRELPEVVFLSSDEGNALTGAEMAIEEALHARRYSADVHH